MVELEKGDPSLGPKLTKDFCKKKKKKEMQTKWNQIKQLLILDNIAVQCTVLQFYKKIFSNVVFYLFFKQNSTYCI